MGKAVGYGDNDGQGDEGDNDNKQFVDEGFHNVLPVAFVCVSSNVLQGTCQSGGVLNCVVFVG